MGTSEVHCNRRGPGKSNPVPKRCAKNVELRSRNLPSDEKQYRPPKMCQSHSRWSCRSPPPNIWPHIVKYSGEFLLHNYKILTGAAISQVMILRPFELSRIRRNYRPFPLEKGGALQTRSTPPNDLRKPDKRCGISPRSTHGYRHAKIRAPFDLQAAH